MNTRDVEGLTWLKVLMLAWGKSWENGMPAMVSSSLLYRGTISSCRLRTVSTLLPIKLAVEALCRRDSNLLTANATMNFLLQSRKEQYTSLSEELCITLKKRTEEWDTEIENILRCQVIYSQFGLAIHQNDHQARRRFVEWARNEIAVVPDFHKRILFSDEAHFWLNGYVNKQNCRIWSEANPQVAKITNFFIPELNNHDVQELWFQQDGATCHTARAAIDLLKDTLGDRLISRFGPVNWPPRSCDLTPLDYFLWGYVKSLVYVDKPQTLDHLEDNIRRVIADIRPQMLEKVIENWTSRLDYIRVSRGSPMPEIIFKI
ncbi:transposable element Tc3 transposase [Trichonephila clavipes]|nr:transposable element Tc3 transposase [Trichonephila clavipes]